MSVDYAYINNFQGRGNIAISRNVFKDIAYHATNKVHGATVSGKKSSPFDLYNPIEVIIHKDGNVDIKIDVQLKKGVDVNDVCLNIQKEVKTALEEMIEHVRTKVIINIASIA